MLRLLLLLVLLSPVAVVARVVARTHGAGRSINLPEIVEELREQTRAMPAVVHDVGCDLRENALWLSRAWLSAVGVDGILYDRAAVVDCADDEDAMLPRSSNTSNSPESEDSAAGVRSFSGHVRSFC